MTREYRLHELAKAEQEHAAARIRFDTAKTNKARREVDEDLQFWGSKVAFLLNKKIESAPADLSPCPAHAHVNPLDPSTKVHTTAICGWCGHDVYVR